MRDLETPRLLLRRDTRSMPQPELEATWRLYVEELDGPTLSFEDFEREVLFDQLLTTNSLGRHFGRPAIVLKETARRIGHCVFLPRLCTPSELSERPTPAHAASWSSVEVELGWAISDRDRNRGYATEAAQALVTYGFSTLHLARAVAFTERDSAPSLRVMQKLGMDLHSLRDAEGVIGVLENSAP